MPTIFPPLATQAVALTAGPCPRPGSGYQVLDWPGFKSCDPAGDPVPQPVRRNPTLIDVDRRRGRAHVLDLLPSVETTVVVFNKRHRNGRGRAGVGKGAVRRPLTGNLSAGAG